MPVADFALRQKEVDGGAGGAFVTHCIGLPGLAVVAAFGMRLQLKRGDDIARAHCHLNESLRRRVSAKTSASLACSRSSFLRISGLSGRRNTLVLSSSPIVVGKVISPLARWLATTPARCWSARLPGSTESAKRALASLYSW